MKPVRIADVSIIMSVYNTEELYLRKAIESMLNQTFTNFEFIIVMDCPEDNSEDIVAEYLEQDDRIRVIYNEENLGLTKSLNRALEIATGRYIARMDADDFSVPTRLEVQYSYLETHPEIGVVGGHVYTGNKKHRSMTAWNTNPETTKVQMLFHNAGVPHPTAMFRREINGEPVRYNEKILKSQDFELWSRLVHRTRIVVLDEVFLIYRIHPRQISADITEQYFFSRCIIENQMRNYLDVESFEAIEVAADLCFGRKEVTDDRYKKMFSIICECNEKKHAYDTKELKKVLEEIYVEYQYEKLLENYSKIKVLLALLKEFGVDQVCSFIKLFLEPKIKHDKLVRRFARNERILIQDALGEKGE